MPSWFSKAFKQADVASKLFSERELPKTSNRSASLARPQAPPAKTAAPHPTRKERRIVHAPILVDEEQLSGWSKEIRVKARVSRDHLSCVFMVDRPVLEGYSAWYADAEAAKDAPLADYLFGVPGVMNVLLHDFTVTVTRDPGTAGSWEDLAKEVGARIRNHLLNGVPVVAPEFLAKMPPEEAIRGKLLAVIDLEINPGIASHSGVITLNRVLGNTAYITMGGGCQGCAASSITLREGIYHAFREAIPQIGAILDETDHTAGSNPFYRKLPEGMEAHA